MLLRLSRLTPGVPGVISLKLRVADTSDQAAITEENTYYAQLLLLNGKPHIP